MDLGDRRLVGVVGREMALAGVAILGTVVFLLHPELYLNGSPGHAVTVGNFLLVTVILYVLLRLIFFVAGYYLPRTAPRVVVCPECGHPLDGSHTKTARHRKILLTAKPTEREVLAAVMLRKAIDDARKSSQRRLAGASELPPPPSDVENPPISIEEFERILQDLDRSRRPRRGDDPGPKGPSPPSG